MKQAVALGTQYLTRGKYPRLATVIDILTTTNLAGEIVKVRYVSTHQLMGQTVTDRDVLETSILMGARSISEVA